jgi:hypothetical protein
MTTPPFLPTALRRIMPARNRKFADSLLEGTGFELPVPRENGYRSESSGFVYLPETVRVSPKGLADIRDRSFESTSLQRGVSELSVPLKTTPVVSLSNLRSPALRVIRAT